MTANQAIEIGGVRVKPGERANVDLPIADLSVLDPPIEEVIDRVFTDG